MTTLPQPGTPYYGGGQVTNPVDSFQTSGAPSTVNINHKIGTVAVDPSATQAYMLLGKSGGSATWAQLAQSSSGLVPVSKGGTGVATMTGIPLGSGTSAFTAIAFTPVTAWTPNVQINGVSTGITYTTRVGAYQQIGNAVYISANIVFNSIGASTGNVTISNLPVATGAAGANNTMPAFGSTVTNTASYTNLQLNFGTSSAVGTFYESGSGQVTQVVTNGRIANGSTLQFSGVYFIN